MRFNHVYLVAGAASFAVALIIVRRRLRFLSPSQRYLTLVQEIPMLLPPDDSSARRGAEGRIDHFACDSARKLLFVACLGEDCVLVVDCFAGRVVRKLDHYTFDAETMSQRRLARPQGVLFVAPTQRLYVANAADGRVVVFDTSAPPCSVGQWSCVGCVDFGEEADNLRYSPSEQTVYVGYGEGPEGAIGAIDDSQATVVATARRPAARELPCDDHPESFHLEQRGEARRVWVNVASTNEVRVLDRTDPRVIVRWPLPDGLRANFPMHAEEESRVLFVGVRQPAHRACVLILDLDLGHELRRIPCAGDMDELCYDAARSRLYVVSGTGRVCVLARTGQSRSSYELVAEISTSLGARTGFWYAARDSLYVAAPSSAGLPSRLLVFQGIDC